MNSGDRVQTELALGSDQFCNLLKRTAGKLTVFSIHLDEASTSDIDRIQAFLSQYKGNGTFFKTAEQRASLKLVHFCRSPDLHRIVLEASSSDVYDKCKEYT